MLQSRVPDLFDLLDELVSLRLDLCTDGDPARPVQTLTPEKIEGLCALVTGAIATTNQLIDLLEVDPPLDRFQPPRFTR